tara:strand:- start:1248 stop:1457 length:210 start_codon:yes stop_codon:yes gene_type:complete
MTLAKQQLWLVEQFQAYRKKHKLPNLSADDLTNPPYRGKLTGQQIDWLQQFIVVWEVVEYDVNQNSGNT